MLFYHHRHINIPVLKHAYIGTKMYIVRCAEIAICLFMCFQIQILLGRSYICRTYTPTNYMNIISKHHRLIAICFCFSMIIPIYVLILYIQSLKQSTLSCFTILSSQPTFRPISAVCNAQYIHTGVYICCRQPTPSFLAD